MAALDAFRGRIGTMWRPYRPSRDIFDGQIAGVPPHRAVHRGHMAPNTPLGDPPGGFQVHVHTPLPPFWGPYPPFWLRRHVGSAIRCSDLGVAHRIRASFTGRGTGPLTKS